MKHFFIVPVCRLTGLTCSHVPFKGIFPPEKLFRFAGWDLSANANRWARIPEAKNKMNDKQTVIKKIQTAFQDLQFPGENFLQGSFEGEEPFEEVSLFQMHKNWTTVEPSLLDAHASALSFFSEAGFRFFLPAYLIADLNEELHTADPVFHLTHGFFDFTVQIPVGGRVFNVKNGKSSLINPRRYGAATTNDYARYRMSIFTREEADAIVAYLEYKRDSNPNGFDQLRIDAALEMFWRERAHVAPSADILRQHLSDEKEYLEAIQSAASNNTQPS